MAKTPQLPRLPKLERKVKSGGRQVVVPLKPQPGGRPPRVTPKFRDPERSELAARTFKDALAEEVGKTREELDKRALESRPVLDVLRKAVGEGFFEPMSIDEKLFAIEAYFERNLSGKEIARQLGRNHSTVTRFLRKYKSTVPLARRLLEGSAEQLAERVIKKANVTEALEVLDRVDALPKKTRDDGQSAPRFNIFVGMPGKAATAPVPDQRAIEAAAVKIEEE